MSKNPINLAFRFLLELSALFSVGFWAYQLVDGWLSIVLAIGLPFVLSAIWGVFAVPNDPSRSGNAPIPTPGILRLIIEFTVFGFGVWTLKDIGLPELSWIFGILVFVHYLFSYKRIHWLLSKK